MAWQVQRPGRRGVYIKYFDTNTYKEDWIPRAKTKHLDGKPADEILEWIAAWEKKHGRVTERSERIHLTDTDKAQVMWNQYQKNRMATHDRRQSTADAETECFELHMVPFFIGIHKKKNPVTWHDLVPAFHTYLFERKFKDATIAKTLWALERFGKYLVFQRLMTYPFAVQVPARGNSKETRLKVLATPEDILKLSEEPSLEYEFCNFQLAVLLAYFGGLGPSELFALFKSDILTGEEAAKFTKTHIGFKDAGWGTRLSVRVTKTLANAAGAEPKELTKNSYRRAVANIWHPEAARRIVAIVRDMPEGRLFNGSYSGLTRAWRDRVRAILDITPHDMRRASCAFVGRKLRLAPTLAQEHMRHANLTTTMLYMREPVVPEPKTKALQNFDDYL